MYPYLTGSASWLLLTMLAEVYGVKGNFGDLVIEPKLSQEIFDEQGMASVSTQFAGRQLQVTYSNPERLEFGGYSIHAIKIDGKEITIDRNKKSATLSREVLEDLSSDQLHGIEVELRSH